MNSIVLTPEEDMNFGERLSIIMELYMSIQSKNLEEYNEEDIENAVLSIIKFIDDCKDEFYTREALYLKYKTLNIPIVHKYLSSHKLFTKMCKRQAEDYMERINQMGNLSGMWRNTKIAIEDFIYETRGIVV
jgi:hypothetical protein